MGNTNGGLHIADDVVITPEGRIGAGTLTPQARLDIRGSIRIADGTEGGGKILTSDATGAVQWTSIAGSWYAALKEGRSEGASTGTDAEKWPPLTYSSCELSSQVPGIDDPDPAAGTITVPYTATYRITITGKAYTNPPAGNISPAQASDDVLITPEGRIGIGLPAPAVKVDIIPTTTPGSGTASRAFPATGSWYAALYNSPPLGYSPTPGSTRTFTAYTGQLTSPSYQGQGSADKTAGTITLPATGKYRITITVEWTADSSSGRTAPYPAKAILHANATTESQTFGFWGGAIGYKVMPSFFSILEFQAGDILTLSTDETQPSYANNARAVLFMVELLL
jgi:hypothetical protein